MPLSAEAAVEGLLANRSKLLAYAWSLLRDHHATEDVFQEVVLLAMKNAAEIKDKDHLLVWARRTARNRGIDYLRRQSHRPVLLADDVLDLLEDQWSEFDGLSQRDRLDALRECSERLTPRSQQILLLRYGQGVSGRGVAEALQQSTHAVYVALTRIYHTLEECIRRKLSAGG